MTRSERFLTELATIIAEASADGSLLDLGRLLGRAQRDGRPLGMYPEYAVLSVLHARIQRLLSTYAGLSRTEQIRCAVNPLVAAFLQGASSIGRHTLP